MDVADTSTVLSDTLRALHDRLLADRPDGAEHEEGSCPFCALEALQAAATAGGAPSPISNEGGLMTTLTQEEHEAAVAEAVAKAIAEATAPLSAKIAEFEAANADTEVGKAVAEATAPLNEKISTLQSELEAAVLAQTAAETALAETEGFWAQVSEAAEAEALAASRKDERLARIREVANFPEEFLTKNADVYASLTDEDFEVRVAEMAETAKTIAEVVGGKIPAATALTAARDASGGSNNQGSALSELGAMRRALTDPRTL